MKKVREPPFDCFYDASTTDHLLVHRKGLFFLKFDMQVFVIDIRILKFYSKKTVCMLRNRLMQK